MFPEEKYQIINKEEKAPETEDVVFKLKQLKALETTIKKIGLKEKERAQLEKILESDENCLIKTKAKQLLTKPLNDWSIKEKRSLFKYEWVNITHPAFVSDIFGEKANIKKIRELDPTDKQQVDDKEINRIFNLYRALHPAYFYWMDINDRVSRYNDKQLTTFYNIDTLHGDKHTLDEEKKQLPAIKGSYIISEIMQARRIGQHEAAYYTKANQNSCYHKINDKYGVVYAPNGEIESFFQLDENAETASKKSEEKFGSLSENSLAIFLDRFEKASKTGDKGVFLYYYQIRNFLPKKIVGQIDRIIKSDVPEELDIKFKTMAQFEEMISPYKEQILKNINGNVKTEIINKLKNLLKERGNEATKKYFGFKSEETNNLDFFKSFIFDHPERKNERKHYTIAYYFYIRQYLPDSMREEFEAKFSIKSSGIPAEFRTFDDFLLFNDKKLIEPFEEKPENFWNAAYWLYKKIDELSEKIKDAKVQPKKISLQEILIKEGYGSEKKEDFMAAFSAFLELSLKEYIEKELSLKINKFSIREQLQFVNFLSTKSIKEFEKVKEFLNKGENKNAKKNRAKSFFSLELDTEMGNKIMAIGEKLKDQPKLADRLFAEYAKMVDEAERTAEEISKLYEETFYEKRIDKSKVIMAIFKKAGVFLSDAEMELKEAPKDKKRLVIEELIRILSREKEIQQIAIAELLKIGADLSTRFLIIDKECTKIEKNIDKELMKNFLSYKEKGDLDKKDYMRLIDIMYDVNNDPENWAAIAPAFEQEEVEKAGKKHQRYDSQRIRNMIDYYEKLYSGEDKHLLPKKEDLIKQGLSEEWANKKIEDSLKKIQRQIGPMIKKLNNLLLSQIALEKKLDEFIYEKKRESKTEKSLPEIVLNKYGELVEKAKKGERELKVIFKDKQEIIKQVSDKVIERLMKKASQLLKNYSELALKGKSDQKTIMEQLKETEADLELKIQTMKILRKEMGYSIKPDDFEDIIFQKKTAKELMGGEVIEEAEKILTQANDISIPGRLLRGAFKKLTKTQQRESSNLLIQMLDMYAKNYEDKSALQKKLLISFLQTLKEKNSLLYIYSKGDRLLAFDRFDNEGDRKRYFGSFNVNPAIRGSAIGDALMEASLKQESLANDIEADCLPETLISSRYIDAEGFIVKKVFPDYEKTGEFVFNIAKKEKTETEYKKYSREDIIREYIKNPNTPTDANPDKFVVKFKSNSPKFKTAVEDLINNRGYEMTRYFFAGPNNQEVYCAFERMER